MNQDTQQPKGPIDPREEGNIPEGNTSATPSHRNLALLISLAVDAGIVALGYCAALLLRFDGSVPTQSWHWYGYLIAPFIGVFLLTNFSFGVYRSAWRYGSLQEVIHLTAAVGAATGVFLIVLLALPTPRHIPLSVNLIAGVLIFLLLGFIKLWPRLAASQISSFNGWEEIHQRVLIVGADNSGEVIAREFLHNRLWGYRPICFVDDDLGKHGMRIHGLPVLGNRYSIPSLISKYRIDLVAVAGGEAELRELLAICQAAGVPARLVPTITDILSGRALAGQMREITVGDLLEREPLSIDYARCAEFIGGRSVLVTGAAGSIGSELCRQLLAIGPASLHLLDNNESGLYDLLAELLPINEGCEVKLWVADTSNRARIDQILQSAQPYLVFHAAAYKHVPLMEEHPEEAFRVNVVGTLNLCQAAQQYGVQKFVFVSTDKAVNPTSVMGATKRIGELLVNVIGRQRAGTTFCAVRFGNVMGSRGSVIPLFWRQIQHGGPISITHPEMSRYFLTVPEAVSLIIQASAFAHQGQIFLLDMGEEVKIVDLAEKMIRLGGLSPHSVPIVYTGLRPGEKLREELINQWETLGTTSHPKVFLAERGRPITLSSQRLVSAIQRLASLNHDRESLIEAIQALARLDQRDASSQVS